MSTENFKQSPGKRSITFCRGQIHWLTKAEFESVKASGMFGEFYPDQPERWEDLPDPAATPTPLASTAMAAATPRTDAVEAQWRDVRTNPFIVVYHARQLERELAAFQPLLAKVEGEISTLRTERDVAIDKLLATLAALRADLAASKQRTANLEISREFHVQEADKYAMEAQGNKAIVSQLRADLAAKEAALEVAVDALKCARSVIGSEARGSGFDGAKDCIKIALAGCLSALASRADKGGAR